MPEIYNKNWSTLIPPYDSDELENDLEAQNEYKISKMNFKFNEHGLGFNEFGDEEVFEMKMELNPNLNSNIEKHDTYKNHEEL